MPAMYRFELAKTARAGCKNSACKKAGLKIAKGEFRAGTWVEIPNGGAGWHWKHWGCVTPKQLENLKEQIDGLDFDSDEDMEVIDGWDDLDQEHRELLREALKQGHVGDDVWKGDPGLNRPGQKGINKRTPKKKPEAEPEDGGAEAERVDPVPIGAMRKKKGAGAITARRPYEHTRSEDMTESEEEKPKPKKGKKTAKKATADDNDDVAPAKKGRKNAKTVKAEADDEKPAPAKKGRKNAKAAAEDEEAAPAAKPKKGSKAAAAAAAADEEVEEAPPTQKKATKGRGKKAKATVVEEEQAEDPEPEFIQEKAPENDASEEQPAPKANRGKKRTRAQEEVEDTEPAPAKKAKGKAKGKKAKA